MEDIEDKFWNAISAWLNGDCVDLGDPIAINNATSGVIGHMGHLSNAERAALKTVLLQMLASWNMETIMRFVEVTNIDWTFNAEMEQTLKDIVTKLSQSFEPYKNAAGHDTCQ